MEGTDWQTALIKHSYTVDTTPIAAFASLTLPFLCVKHKATAHVCTCKDSKVEPKEKKITRTHPQHQKIRNGKSYIAYMQRRKS